MHNRANIWYGACRSYKRASSVSQKGSAGKTTLAAHLTVEAGRNGAGPVAVVDTEPQGSLAAWWNAREAPTPLFAAVAIARLPDHLRMLTRRQITLVVIDTPPAPSPLGGPTGCCTGGARL